VVAHSGNAKDKAPIQQNDLFIQDEEMGYNFQDCGGARFQNHEGRNGGSKYQEGRNADFQQQSYLEGRKGGFQHHPFRYDGCKQHGEFFSRRPFHSDYQPKLQNQEETHARGEQNIDDQGGITPRSVSVTIHPQ
jgi:hypothetical protein